MWHINVLDMRSELCWMYTCVGFDGRTTPPLSTRAIKPTFNVKQLGEGMVKGKMSGRGWMDGRTRFICRAMPAIALASSNNSSLSSGWSVRATLFAKADGTCEISETSTRSTRVNIVCLKKERESFTSPPTLFKHERT